MKHNNYALFIVFSLLLLTAACSQGTKLEITNKEHTDIHEDSNCQEKTGL